MTLPILFLAPSCVQAPAGEGVDLLLVDGTVWTGVQGAPYAEAVAARGGRIVYVGSSAGARRLVGPSTRVLELDGRFVAPGFIDNHTHFNRAGELLLGVNLLDVADEEGLVRRVGEAAERLPDGAWMVGGMWGAYEQWGQSSTGRGGDGPTGPPFRPERSGIDAVSDANPALLWNWDRSQHLANGAALAAAGATCAWAGVECGDGVPTGRVSADAAARIQAAMPPKTLEQRLAEARVALQQLRELGVTTFFDITPPEQLPVYEALREGGELTARVNVRPVLDSWDELAAVGIGHGFGDDWIRFGGLKGFVDGIMGNSSAHFYEPYLTTGVRGSWRDAGNTGHVTGQGSGLEPAGNMERLLFGADSIGLSPRVHAIGDQAVDTLIDLMEKVIREHGPRPDRRFAIIHTQVLSGAEAAERMARLGIIAEVQPYHTIDDMRWMEERIGARSRWAYAFRTLHDAGVVLSFGSDWPGTNAAWYTADPLQGMYAAVTRQTLDGQPAEGWFPEERIDVETALRAYTVNNAFAAGEEDRKGTLEVGKLA
ncbi:MAG: amidohydrolase, partial [Gemmatimonadetes bacterium]|nr:amidohydrolase [Gemmatimonadota bacterium]